MGVNLQVMTFEINDFESQASCIQHYSITMRGSSRTAIWGGVVSGRHPQWVITQCRVFGALSQVLGPLHCLGLRRTGEHVGNLVTI